MKPGKRSRIVGQFAARPIEMLRSPAMAVLSLSARRLLDRLEIEFADHGGTENGRLPVTYEHFVEFGIERHAIAPAIREAQALGFIEVTEKGIAGNREFRRPSLYRLTYRHGEHTGPTHEWRRVDTLAEASAIARAARSKKQPTRQKQKSSVGKHPASMRETPTEGLKVPMRETPLLPQCGKPPLPLYPGKGTLLDPSNLTVGAPVIQAARYTGRFRRMTREVSE